MVKYHFSGFPQVVAHGALWLLLSGLGVEECAFICDKVPSFAPPHLHGHNLRLLHGVLVGVVGHVPAHCLSEQCWVYMQKRGIVVICMALVLLALFKFFLGGVYLRRRARYSSIGAGPCGSWWDLDRLTIWVFLRMCTYRCILALYKAHHRKLLKVEVLIGIKLCYYIFRAGTQLLLTTLSW